VAFCHIFKKVKIMTAWTAIVVPLFFIAKCSSDFLVLEYGSKFQVGDDQSFFTMALLYCSISLIIDLGNVAIRIFGIGRKG